MKSEMVSVDEIAYHDLGRSLIDSILSPKFIAQTPSVIDVALHCFTDVAFLSEIPVFDSFFKLYKGVTTVQNDLSLKRIAYFLSGCNKDDLLEKTQFVRDLELDSGLRTKVGESLLLILERGDHFDKASIIGKIFVARLRDDIDEGTFYRLATVVNNASIPDLRTLELSYGKIASYNAVAGNRFTEHLDDDTSQSLYNLGLVRAEGLAEIIYRPNQLGSQLIRFLK